MPLKRIRPVFKPSLYHGWGRSRNFFEGWYFKIVNNSADRIYAIIPGVSIDSKGNKHSFIQLLDGINESAEYFKFGFEDFSSSKTNFEISIGDNTFSESRLELNLPGFKGNLDFIGLNRWPNRWYSPGIMGPYTFAPFMECYHGILSLDHQIKGEISMAKELTDFNGGRGYIEKDWGRSFPEAYIWLQSNHFNNSGTSIKVSIARIPWLGSSFTGFIAGVLIDGQLYQFTTYNGSSLNILNVSLGELEIELLNKRVKLSLKIKREKATRLAAPISGSMTGHISETMQANTIVRLEDRKYGTLIFEGSGQNTALEVAGDITKLSL